MVEHLLRMREARGRFPARPRLQHTALPSALFFSFPACSTPRRDGQIHQQRMAGVGDSCSPLLPAPASLLANASYGSPVATTNQHMRQAEAGSNFQVQLPIGTRCAGGRMKQVKTLASWIKIRQPLPSPR